jgi:cytosine/adenosine deaminase-related metal-dependent hydrolase
MLAETRQAMLVGRLAAAPGVGMAGPLLEARTALELATLGGAAVLGRDDIGSLEAGKACDFAAFAIDDLAHAGAQADPVAALVLCAPPHATTTVVGGRSLVQHGALTTVESERLVVEHNQLARDLWEA